MGAPNAAVAFVASSMWFKLGAVLGALAVLMGAFGAHKLKSTIDDVKLIKTWETAAHYHLVHALLFFVVPFAARPAVTGTLLLLGVALFSGSLYALVLTRIRILGAITPIGGLLMTAAWASFLLGAPAA